MNDQEQNGIKEFLEKSLCPVILVGFNSDEMFCLASVGSWPDV